MLAFIVGLRAEAALLPAHVFVGGGDAPGAARATHAAIQAGARALISFGLAGGLSPKTPPGTLLIPRTILHHATRTQTDPALTAALGGPTCDTLLAADAIVASQADKASLYTTSQADGVDLESGAVAEAASRAGLPFAALRAVCDPAWRTMPPAALLAIDTGGAIRPGRVLASIARHPGQLATLLALARDAAHARRALRHHLATLHRTAALIPWMGA